MDNTNRTARKKRKKQMRLPNGLGSVHLIGDAKSRRKPWRARVPSHIEFDEINGTAKQKYITIGYYATQAEGMAALFEYQKNPYTLEASTCSFADVFEMWKAKKYPEISASGQKGYNAAFKSSSALHNMKMRDIRTLHLENVMQNLTGGHQKQAVIKIMWGQMFKYAIEHDIVQKNYAEFVKTKDKDEGTTRTAIPPEAINKVWQAIDEGNEDAEIVMMYIYTGFRLSELLEIPIKDIDLDARIIVGGMKTAAGKNRRVPIHKCILPFIEKRMKQNKEFLIEGKGKYANQPLKSHHLVKRHWDKIMPKLGLAEYTPHYARHTCATMLRTAGIEEDLRKLILGHSRNDITDRYTHVPDSMLIEAIDKVQGRE